MATEQTTKTIQKYTVYVKATPQAIWDALTRAEWTVKYGYAPLVDYELRAGGKFRAYPNEGMKEFGVPDVIIDGEVLEATAPRKLAQTWRMLMDCWRPELSYRSKAVRRKDKSTPRSAALACSRTRSGYLQTFRLNATRANA
jgi:uncharacterized protein YndB with AHSA1/START domain